MNYNTDNEEHILTEDKKDLLLEDANPILLESSNNFINDMAEYKMGTDLMLFKDNTTPLACAKSCKFSIQVNTLDVSSKDSGYFTEKIAGKISFSCSSDNMFVMADYKDLVDAMLKRTPIQIQFSSAKGSAPSWQPNADGYKGEAFITSIEANASDGEVATYSVSLDGTGALTAVVA